MTDKHIHDTDPIILKKHTKKKDFEGISNKIIQDNDFSEIHKPKCDNLGKKLCEFRCARQQNQETFAKCLGISKQELNNIESGKLIVNNQKLQQINNKLHRLRFIK